jgi:hypothetical protein
MSCSQCDGRGFVQGERCIHCRGTGHEPGEPVLVVAFIDTPLLIYWIDRTGKELEQQRLEFNR